MDRSSIRHETMVLGGLPCFVRVIGASDFSKYEDFYRLIIEYMKNSDVILIRNFVSGANYESLLRLANSLGYASFERTIVPRRKLSHEFIYTIREEGDGLYDNGLLIYSTTNRHFSCHTDDSCNENPRNTIMMYCEKAAPSGGMILLCRLSDILYELSSDEISVLEKQIFPFQFGVAPILKHEGRNYTIRYNRLEIDRYRERLALDLPKNVEYVLDKIDRIVDIKSKENSFLLLPGDCLIINNDSILHGRTEFPKGSNRVLKRLKLYSDLWRHVYSLE
jgi:hypothetical protein